MKWCKLETGVKFKKAYNKCGIKQGLRILGWTTVVSMFVKIDVRDLDLLCSPIFITLFRISWPAPTYLVETSGWRVGNITVIFPPPFGAAAQRGPWPPHSRGFYITQNDASHSIRLLWTRDQCFAETSTWQHTTLTTDRHPCLRWDSNPQSQQAIGRRPTP